jgi:hypothetical protein
MVFAERGRRSNGVANHHLSDQATIEILQRRPLYDIVVRAGVVWLQLRIPAETRPEDGASSAQSMVEYLLNHVVGGTRRFRGLVVDVREGPAVFGPITRRWNERLFAGAAHARIRTAVLVGNAALQRLHFGALAREFGNGLCQVTDRADQVDAWLV